MVSESAEVWQNHHPGLAVSAWLDCSCGWDAQKSKLDWLEHIEAAVHITVTVNPDDEVDASA